MSDSDSKYNDPEYMIAYFIDDTKIGRQVLVPLFHCPKDMPTTSISEEGPHYSPSKITKARRIKRKEVRDAKQYSANSCLVPWLLTNKQLKTLCTENNIPISWIIPCNIGNIDTLKTRHFENNCSRRKCRKYNYTKASDFKKFIIELRNLHPQSAIVAEILWYLNKEFGQINSYITLSEVLLLKKHCVSFDNLSPCMIQLERSGRHIVCHCIEKSLANRLAKQMLSYSSFAISNRRGGPLKASDVTKHFAEACKAAGISQVITSLNLRPFSPKQPKKFRTRSGKSQYTDTQLKEISREEWLILSQLFHTDAKNRGRKSLHDQREILNAILYHLRKDCPIRKLPFSIPHSAIESQYRRWRKNGFLDKILKSRNS